VNLLLRDRLIDDDTDADRLTTQGIPRHLRRRRRYHADHQRLQLEGRALLAMAQVCGAGR
jgi:hypothetical protein